MRLVHRLGGLSARCCRHQHKPDNCSHRDHEGSHVVSPQAHDVDLAYITPDRTLYLGGHRASSLRVPAIPAREMTDTDARLWHPWLRINRVLRVMLQTHWSAEVAP